MDKTDIYKTYEELEKKPPQFEVYIAGSDQVFNPKEVEIRTNYLDFCPKGVKKIAYAPSFGLSFIPDEHKEFVKSRLDRFDFLSAREKSGCKIIKELTGRDVPNVLDPVFLLEPTEFQKIANPVKLGFNDYLLCYGLNDFKEQLKFSKRIKQMTGLPIVLITRDPRPIKGVDKIIRFAGPREFLWLFSHSKFIVTDSFHGTAFSLVFQKPFFSYIAFPAVAGRITSLLGNVGLMDRIIKTPEEISQANIDFDFKEAYGRLEKMRDISKQYLKQAIRNGK